jgi:hypothetical protein
VVLTRNLSPMVVLRIRGQEMIKNLYQGWYPSTWIFPVIVFGRANSLMT